VQRRNVIAMLSEISNNAQLMVEMDQINASILRILSRDGRISNLALADAVGLSPSACLRRVQEMERSGVITGYRAHLDPVRTGRAYVVYVAVGLAEHTKAAQTGFEQAMAVANEVTECHNVLNTCCGSRWRICQRTSGFTPIFWGLCHMCGRSPRIW
jgi:DNA-binding Lrp family transcriptional regulator